MSLLDAEGQVTDRALPAPEGQATPNVLIFLFDTLSAAHLSLHGYGRETSPNLARFADKATVYHAHYSAGNFTPPGTASLLTGTYPWTHRALHHAGIVTKQFEDRNMFGLLKDTHSCLAYPLNTWVNLMLYQFRHDIDHYLSPQEFCLLDATARGPMFSQDLDPAFRSFEDLLFRQISFPGSLFASFAHKLKLMAHESVGLADLAELYPRGVPNLDLYKLYFLVEDLVDGIAAQLSNLQQPSLAYFHLFPPHEPYCPRREFVGSFDDGWTPVTKKPHVLSPGHSQEELNQWRIEYDEYVAHVDAEFGRLYDFMERTGLMDNSYVVFTSDHGQLFERGVHGHDTRLLYEPVIRVPLLISRPGQERREDISEPTSCVDLLPTLLDAMGQEIPSWCEGKVLPMRSDEQSTSERSVFSVEAKSNPVNRPLTTATIALIRGQYKLIHTSGYEGYDTNFELYDLANDPEELEDISSTKRSTAADLQQELEEKLQRVNQGFMP
jgi:arylsulfatase A-like enzyme